MHLLQHFKELTVKPKNAQELKGLILQLAIQGKLTSKWRKENPDVESASELFKQINGEKLPTKISEDNIPYKIPISWNWYNLVDLSSINGGFAFKSSNYIEEGVRVIRISDFDENGFKNHKIVRHEYSNSLESYVLEDKNILIAMTGGTVGKSLFVDKVPEVMVVNQRVATIKIFKPIYEAYVNCVIPTKLIQDVIEEAKNSTNDNISMSNIKGFKIPLPPLEEQKAIVEIVETLFKEVEQLEQLTLERISLKEDFVTSALNQLAKNNAKKEWALLQEHFHSFFNETTNIKKLRETVLQLAVQGKLTSTWRASHPELVSGSNSANELLKRIQKEKAQLINEKKIKKEKPLPSITKDEIPYELPEGWVWCRMRDVSYSIVPNRDKPKSFTGEITWLTTRNFNLESSKIHHKSDDNKLSQNELNLYNARLLPIHSVVMSCVGQFGLSAVLEQEYSCNQQLHCFVPLGMVNPFYLDSVIKNSKKNLESASSATTIAYLNKTKCDSLIVSLPPLEEQKIIVEKVNALMGLCDALEQQVIQSQEQSEKLMQSVLREVFEGKKELEIA